MRFTTTALLVASIAAGSASAGIILERQQVDPSAPNVPMCTNVDPACDVYKGIMVCMPTCYIIEGLGSTGNGSAIADSVTDSVTGNDNNNNVNTPGDVDGASIAQGVQDSLGNIQGSSSNSGQTTETSSNNEVNGGGNNYGGQNSGQSSSSSHAQNGDGMVNGQTVTIGGVTASNGGGSGATGSSVSMGNGGFSVTNGRKRQENSDQPISCDLTTLKCTDGKQLTGCRIDYNSNTNVQSISSTNGQCGLTQGDGRSTGAAAPNGAAPASSSAAASSSPARSSTSSRTPSSTSSSAPPAGTTIDLRSSGAMDLQPRVGAALLAGLALVATIL